MSSKNSGVAEFTFVVDMVVDAAVEVDLEIGVLLVVVVVVTADVVVVVVLVTVTEAASMLSGEVENVLLVVIGVLDSLKVVDDVVVVLVVVVKADVVIVSEAASLLSGEVEKISPSLKGTSGLSIADDILDVTGLII